MLMTELVCKNVVKDNFLKQEPTILSRVVGSFRKPDAPIHEVHLRVNIEVLELNLTTGRYVHTKTTVRTNAYHMWPNEL